MYRQLTEHNDNEGETWHFWLEIDGNEEALTRLDNYLEAAMESGELDEHYPEFRLSIDTIEERALDVFVEHSDDGYFPTHVKVAGQLILPNDLEEQTPGGFLYKGGILDFFHERTN